MTLEEDTETFEKLYPLPTDVAMQIVAECGRRIQENVRLQSQVMRALTNNETEPALTQPSL